MTKSLSDKPPLKGFALMGTNQETVTEPGVFTEGEKRYRNKIHVKPSRTVCESSHQNWKFIVVWIKNDCFYAFI